jgi:hypothetical protein
LVELRVADESKLVLVGTILLLANVCTLFLALYLQVGEGDRRVQLNLTLAENEMRETELLHEQEQMKADIEELLSRYGLKLDVSASTVESAGPVSKAAKMQEELFLQAVKECNELPSFTKRSHPCWMISVTRLQAFDALPVHEEVIDKLEELLPDSTSPSCAYSFFIRFDARSTRLIFCTRRWRIQALRLADCPSHTFFASPKRKSRSSGGGT